MRYLIYLIFLRFFVSSNACKKMMTPNSLVSVTKIIEYSYPKNDGSYKNLLKDWNAGWWKDCDYASVGFQYIKWKVFEPTDDNFDIK